MSNALIGLREGLEAALVVVILLAFLSNGLTRTFHVELSEPGTHETARKPGMVGDGIRAPFTVTGTSAAPKSEEESPTAETTTSHAWVATRAEESVARTTDFGALSR